MFRLLGVSTHVLHAALTHEKALAGKRIRHLRELKNKMDTMAERYRSLAAEAATADAAVDPI